MNVDVDKNNINVVDMDIDQDTDTDDDDEEMYRLTMGTILRDVLWEWGIVDQHEYKFDFNSKIYEAAVTDFMDGLVKAGYIQKKQEGE